MIKIKPRKALQLVQAGEGRWHVLLDKLVVYQGDATGAANVHDTLRRFEKRVRRNARRKATLKAVAICDMSVRHLLDRENPPSGAQVVAAVLRVTAAVIGDPWIERLTIEQVQARWNEIVGKAR